MSDNNKIIMKGVESGNSLLTVFEMILKNRDEIKRIDIDIDDDDETKDPTMKLVFIYDRGKLSLKTEGE